jgi:energy-coupling factor transport system ATP-binding protein
MALVNLKHVTFFYPEQDQPALEDVNLTLDAGEFTLLIGPSGCGKTTLLQAIAGVVPFSTGGRIRGEIFIEGTDILRSDDKKRGEVGLILQDPEAQLTNLYVEDEVAFGPENLCLAEDEIHRRVDTMIRLARIEEIRDAFVYALSGGQKQRVAIAAGLAMEPRVLLMDGPTTNLDPAGSLEVLNLIKTLTRAEVTETVFVSSNRIDVLLPLATRIVVMDEGRIILDGEPEEIVLGHQEDLHEIGVFVPGLGRMAKQFGLSALPRTVPELQEMLKGAGAPGEPPAERAKPANRAELPSNNDKTAVELADIHFGYDDKLVIHNLSMSVQQGELLAVVGQNGCGKTTLMKLIAGLYQPWEGTVKIGDTYTHQQSPLGRVGYVFQYPEHQFVAQSVEKELHVGQRGHNGEAPQRSVEETLRLFQLWKKRDQSPYSLSMGEKRLLSVATMVILQPEILILDEPTTGLDRRNTDYLMAVLRNLVDERGITLIQVTHDMEQVAQYATHTVVLGLGQVIFQGTPRELFLADELLDACKLHAPPVVELAKGLWPRCEAIPITAQQLTEV